MLPKPIAFTSIKEGHFNIVRLPTMLYKGMYGASDRMNRETSNDHFAISVPWYIVDAMMLNKVVKVRVLFNFIQWHNFIITVNYVFFIQTLYEAPK